MLVLVIIFLQRTRAMFWVVTTSTAFCAISLADVLRCFVTDQWNFRKSRKAQALARFFKPEEQSVAISKQLKTIWHHLRSFRHFYFKEWRMARNAWAYLLDFIRTVLCPNSSERGGNGDNVSEAELGPKEQTQTGIQYSHEYCIENILSLTSHKIHRYMNDKIDDIQFSPDGEWVAYCSTFSCYAILVKPEVSLTAYGDSDGIDKTIFSLRTPSL